MTHIIRPKKSLADAIKDGQQDLKGQTGVDKKFTMMKASGSAEVKDAGSETYDSPVTQPTPEQLEVINTFTRSPKTADEIAVFDTWSANNLVDRDWDYFSDDTLKGFASLPQPFSPIGKSFMVGHDYSSMPVGRIFATDTQEADGTLWLKNSVYMPNTEQYKSFLENQDFGIFWAVSVGVVLDKSLCDICENHMYRFGFCEEGHVKGLWYDPKSEEVDAYGWPEPVEAGTKGAQQALGRFEGARDFYELSQVWLGAQYFAGLEDKDPELAGIVKGAGPKPILLGKDTAKNIPFTHVPKEVAEAKVRFKTKESKDGTLTWTDDQGLVRVFNPDENEVLSLGKAADDDKEGQDNGEDDTQGISSDGDGSESDPEPLGDGEDERSADAGAADSEDGDGSSSAGDPASPVLGPDADMSDERILSAARKAGITGDLLVKAQEAIGDEGSLVDGLLTTLAHENKSLAEEVESLQPKAAMGEIYRKDLIAEAVDWYVKANQSGDGPVSTKTFEKVLSVAGNDVELIKELLEEQKAVAKKRFPGAVRRSSFEADPNSSEAPGTPEIPEPSSDGSKTVRRLHG